MANQQSAQSLPAPAAPGRGFSIQDLVGDFAFRFCGFTVANSLPYRLVGLGRFSILNDGTLIGMHRSAITVLRGAGAKLSPNTYSLKGNLELQSDGSGTAEIRFTPMTSHGQVLDGGFYVMVAGTADRLWFISSGATLPPSGEAADELVSLEAVRLSLA